MVLSTNCSTDQIPPLPTNVIESVIEPTMLALLNGITPMILLCNTQRVHIYTRLRSKTLHLSMVSSVAAIYREMRYIAIKPLYRETRYIAINIYSFRGDFHHTCLRESAQLNRLKRPNTGILRVKSRMPVIW